MCDGSNGTPNLTGRFLQGWGWDDFYTRNVGEYISEGLPNITGSIAVEEVSYDAILATGAFVYGYPLWPGDAGASGDYETFLYYFDASRCSWIYGNSLTVQPRAYTVYYIIKIA